MKPTREIYRPSPSVHDNIRLRTYADLDGAEVYTYERNGKPCARAFGGKRSKPDFNYQFGNEIARESYISNWLTNQRTRIAERKARRKEQSAPHGFKPGQLFYISWGYDQTNVDYYMLTKVRGKTQGYIVPVSQTTVDTATGADYVSPNPDCICKYDVLLGINESDSERGKWKKLTKDGFSCDGRYFAHPCDADTRKYQTASGYGH